MAGAEEPVDDGESIGRVEPLVLGAEAPCRPALIDLALELLREATALRASLPENLAVPVADVVRSMNCYYSNLIEGHDTHPLEIERALRQDFSDDPEQRDLQLEAKAHIEVQRWIDEGNLDGRALTVDGVRDVHRRFCERLPEELLRARSRDGAIDARVVPGAWRETHVRVGRHVPVSPGAIPRFMTRFERAFRGHGPTETLLAAASAHHRLLWIHPFADGNGRVARLMSHAVLRETLDSASLWSVARGLARHVDEYRRLLAEADLPRRNDLDGRGHLGEAALGDFVEFFLRTAADQVRFMTSLVRPRELRARIVGWAATAIEEGELPVGADRLVREALDGDVARASVPAVIDRGDRQARRVTSALLETGVLRSSGPKSALALGLPAGLAPRLLPGLFPSG